jgi:signal transduction histidine kinase
VDQSVDILAPSPVPAQSPVTPLHRRLLDPLPVSIVLALVFTAAGLVELLMRDSVPSGYRGDDMLLIVLTVASALSLALLWWSPFACLCVAAALMSAQALIGYQFTQAAVWAVVIASFSTVAFDAWWRAMAAGFILAAGFVMVFLTIPDATWQSGVSTWLTISVIWIVAVVIRAYRSSVERADRRAALFAADRDARAREAVAQERARLARELHDSVGHALNVVVLHAGAAQRVVETKPDLTREALENIETAGRQALGDIERMLGILRAPGDEPGLDAAPGLGQLGELCRQVREAGLPVTLEVAGGVRDVPSSIDLTGYRIVQEALTNTLKHAGRAKATVRLEYGERDLHIEVLDDGRAPAKAAQGGGHGLMGMRERVATFRGDLEAGPREEGGFAVRARLPLATEGS